MGAEVALALIVLLVAGLFFRGLTETREIESGFRRDGVLLAAYDLTGRDVNDAATRAFAARLLDRLRTAAGRPVRGHRCIRAARHPWSAAARLPDRGARARRRRCRTGHSSNTVTPGYFDDHGHSASARAPTSPG